MQLSRQLLILTVAIAGFSVGTAAQGKPNMCSNRFIAATYSFTCTGVVLPPSAPQGTQPIPIAMVGVASGDVAGNWNGWDTLSLNGTFIPQYLTTDPNLGGVPAQVNADCSGTIKYQMSPPIRIRPRTPATLENCLSIS